MAYQTYITTSPTLRVTAGYPAYPGGGYHRGGDVKVPGDTNRMLEALYPVKLSEVNTARAVMRVGETLS